MKKIPSFVQLPGGIRLNAVPFRIVEFHDDGSPKLFELLPQGSELRGDNVWALFAAEDHLRAVRRKS